LLPISKEDLRPIKKGNGLQFDWKYECRKYEGFVSFILKTRLIEYYQKTLGAVHVGNHKMVIFPKEGSN